MVLPRTCAARHLRQNTDNAEKLVTRLSIFLRKWNFEVLRNITFPVPAFS
jgi:LytS/YehU family sensor histidine kinase